jgi:two-component system, NarL family, nitrate/nitrite response regulator NarL
VLPDVVLLDIGLPDGSGLSVGAAILERHPDTTVIAVTALNDEHSAKRALDTGFRGFISKDSPLSHFEPSIRAANDGQLVTLRRERRGSGLHGDDHAAFLADQLTAREFDVLSMLVDGASSRQIADRLGVSPNTVRTHVQSILTKLQVHSRLEAATYAVRHGLVRSLDEGRSPA